MKTAASKTAKPAVVKAAKIPVSELNLRKAASRLLTSKLVSTEIVYIQHILGNSATQEDLDAKILAVRAMPWASIVLPE